ncbi:phasin family protein [Umezakia ovalisporum]|jgi:polyhydroxyalkanoate synthesis regulator phasin|uniref:phasin family protein n=1 Tax=Umezakia ovalisporum TaxID=75695 RepID=UPI0024745591|nr:hypothetical protein [Umezakia ovalisporum]MBI1241833.1 hypothetical protein [Nostoc sp. RI_552]MDH6088457.1 hypothetical protein [Umezakia ovalisporum Ak1311]
MPGFGDIVQKAFYLGVGLASYAGEKAGEKLSELRLQAQKLADEMVARGEISTEEARRLVEEMMKQAQSTPQPGESKEKPPSYEPRRIEILEEDEVGNYSRSKGASTDDVAELRQKVLEMQEELRNLQQDV